MLKTAFLLKLKSTSWLIADSEEVSLTKLTECLAPGPSQPYLFRSDAKEYQGYNLAQCLSLNAEALVEDDYLIVLKDRPLAFGFKGELKKITLDSEDLKPLPAPLATPFYKEYVFFGSDLVPVLRLDEITAFMATAPQNLKPPRPSLAFFTKQGGSKTTPHLTIFKRKGLACSLNGQLLEVISARNISLSPFPFTPTLIKGIYCHRQALLPVFDLERLGLKNSSHYLDDLLLIVDLEERLTGLLACGLINALPCREEDFIPPEHHNDFLKGLYRYQGKEIPVLRPEALLREEADLARLEEWIKDKFLLANSLSAESDLPTSKTKEKEVHLSSELNLPPPQPKTISQHLVLDNVHLSKTEATPNTYREAAFEPAPKRSLKNVESRPKRKYTKALWLVVGVGILFGGLSLFNLFIGSKGLFGGKPEQGLSASQAPIPSPLSISKETSPSQKPTPQAVLNPPPLNRELTQDDYGYYYIYEVKPGDILANIAWQETGKYENLRLIAKDNSLPDPNLILPRQRLKIYVKRK